jgi:hypothetical protein
LSEEKTLKTIGMPLVRHVRREKIAGMSAGRNL